MILTVTDMITEDHKWESLTWFASHQVGNSSVMTVGECVIKVGCANPLYSHPNCKEILPVRKGMIAHSLGDKSFEMNTDNTIIIPLHTVHNVKNIGINAVQLFIAFSTRRICSN